MVKFSRYMGIRTFFGISAFIVMLVMSECNFLAKPIELSSEHFLFSATTQTSSMEEMQEGINRAEELYLALSKIIPSEYELDSVIVVQLNGNYRTQGPYVDGDGTIQLWRYSAAEGGYWSLFTHELVHAIAFDTSIKLGVLDWASLGFYNEAWAEYVAMLIDPGKTGFPFYGFNEDVVVGHWILQGGPSFALLRVSHEELNLTCAHQSYTMRASWFRFVDETYGRQASLNIMYGGREMTQEVVEEILGDSLLEVDDAWRTWVLQRYSARPEADTEAASYRASISYYRPCQ